MSDSDPDLLDESVRPDVSTVANWREHFTAKADAAWVLEQRLQGLSERAISLLRERWVSTLQADALTFACRLVTAQQRLILALRDPAPSLPADSEDRAVLDRDLLVRAITGMLRGRTRVERMSDPRIVDLEQALVQVSVEVPHGTMD